MNFQRKNEETSYQIQIMLKKFEISKIEGHYSVEHCSMKEISTSLHI